jgi:dTDP-glucose pyrophosphorylase
VIDGWWTDAGTFESLWNASNLLREKQVAAGVKVGVGE